MNATTADHPDPVRAQLRTAVAGVEAAIAETGTDRQERLSAAWKSLVELLALGPAPEVIACPHCGRVGMRGATRCGYCWAHLDAV